MHAIISSWKPCCFRSKGTISFSMVLKKSESVFGFSLMDTLSVPGGIEVVAVSFWDRKENAQGYDSSGYPEVLKILDRFLHGTPHVRTFEVVSSTLQKRTARAAA